MTEKDAMISSLTKELEKIEFLGKIMKMKQQARIFHEAYDINTCELHSSYNIELDPTADDIANYCKYVTLSCKMENEIPLIAMVYIERILRKCGLLVNSFNWKRLLLICLCIASKVWDDDSLENIHFP